MLLKLVNIAMQHGCPWSTKLVRWGYQITWPGFSASRIGSSHMITDLPLISPNHHPNLGFKKFRYFQSLQYWWAGYDVARHQLHQSHRRRRPPRPKVGSCGVRFRRSPRDLSWENRSFGKLNEDPACKNFMSQNIDIFYICTLMYGNIS